MNTQPLLSKISHSSSSSHHNFCDMFSQTTFSQFDHFLDPFSSNSTASSSNRQKQKKNQLEMIPYKKGKKFHLTSSTSNKHLHRPSNKQKKKLVQRGRSSETNPQSSSIPTTSSSSNHDKEGEEEGIMSHQIKQMRTKGKLPPIHSSMAQNDHHIQIVNFHLNRGVDQLKSIFPMK